MACHVALSLSCDMPSGGTTYQVSLSCIHLSSYMLFLDLIQSFFLNGAVLLIQIEIKFIIYINVRLNT